MKRLLFFDIDGTLATPGQPPSVETVRAIRAARAGGHKAFLCTGRTEHSVPGAVREIGFDGGIYSAGGRVSVGGKTIADHPLSRDMVRTIIAVMEREGAFFTLECLRKNYAGGPAPLLSALHDISGGNSELQRIVLASDRNPVAQHRDDPVYKISFLAESREQADRIAGAFDDRFQVVRFNNARPGFPLFAGEVSDRNVHKGLALQRVCAHFGAGPESSVAFGDSMNDAQMLQAAGTGIAMGNAAQQVKDLADQVCESCADSGVAKAMARLGLTEGTI